MRTWIIRHQDLTFTRPMPEAELIKKIESGEVIASDEIAQATSYWFSIQEVEEVKKHFGEHIRLQSLIPTGAETTSSTNTALLKDKLKRDRTPKGLTPAPVNPKKFAAPAQSREVEGPPVRAKIAFAGLLIFIFCGTLLALWLGSQ